MQPMLFFLFQVRLWDFTCGSLLDTCHIGPEVASFFWPEIFDWFILVSSLHHITQLAGRIYFIESRNGEPWFLETWFEWFSIPQSSDDREVGCQVTCLFSPFPFFLYRFGGEMWNCKFSCSAWCLISSMFVKTGLSQLKGVDDSLLAVTDLCATRGGSLIAVAIQRQASCYFSMTLFHPYRTRSICSWIVILLFFAL